MSDHQNQAASSIVSYAPIRLAAPGRGTEIHLRLSAPAEGGPLPVILFSHGFGQSLHSYGPLVHHWAGQGFAVIQPSHLDSRLLGLAVDDPRQSQIWRFRETDLVAILDQLDGIEAAAPALAGRLDRSRIAVAGHSWGAQTASMLLGATHPDPDDGAVVNLADGRVKAGVLLAVPGTGGANLSPFAAQHFPFMHPDFSAMTTPALVVAGDSDRGAMTVRGPDWWREAYDLAPDSKALLTLAGGEHSLGGISNYDAAETTDASPDRVAAIQALSTAWLRSTLYPGNGAWAEAVVGLRADPAPQGQVESK